jgi:hypothetical protein
MASIPYLLYLPLTDFSFSVFWSYFSKSLPWIAFGGLAIVALLIVALMLQKAIARRLEDELVHTRLDACNLLFTPPDDVPRIGF